MQSKEPKLHLPRINEIALQGFSLYTLNPNVSLKCGDGVTCLVGANGIGKSTLLAAINYALTGIVADPLRTFKSIEEDYRFTLSYADKYFSGRIVESDRRQAAISIKFTIGEFEYRLTRGLFEPEELRELSIGSKETSKQIFEGKGKTHRELHSIYMGKPPQKSNFGTVYTKAINEIIGNKKKMWSKKIPLMIQAYFEDMERLLLALAARANPRALLKIAIGTSAYGGVVVPVDLILADIAEAAGWQLTEVQVVRRLRSSPQLWKHEDSEQNIPALRESIVVLRMPEK